MKNNLYICSRHVNGGIYQYQFNGKKYILKSFAKLNSPMYSIAENNKMHVLLRAPFEDNDFSGYLSLDICKNGELLAKSQIITTNGVIACHLCSAFGSIYAVNYASGSITEIGERTVVHKGETQSHTHFVGLTPDKKYLLVTDLGLDKIFIYDKNLNNVNQIDMPKNHGVRHLEFFNEYVFSSNELKSTLTLMKYTDKNLEILDTISLLPESASGFSSASAIRVYKDKILVAIRGLDIISYAEKDGDKLKYLGSFSCGGKTPRDIIFDENRLIVCNQDSDKVTVFEEINGHFNLIQEINIVEPISAVVY